MIFWNIYGSVCWCLFQLKHSFVILSKYKRIKSIDMPVNENGMQEIGSTYIYRYPQCRYVSFIRTIFGLITIVGMWFIICLYVVFDNFQPYLVPHSISYQHQSSTMHRYLFVLAFRCCYLSSDFSKHFAGIAKYFF
jgi:hypothetical protein